MGNDWDQEETKQAPKQKAAAPKQQQARVPDKQFEAAMGSVGASEVDDLELEDKYHSVDDMEAMSVIEHEIEFLEKLIKTIKDKDEREYFANKIDSLKFKKSTIEANV
jgi:hypothetical protein